MKSSDRLRLTRKHVSQKPSLQTQQKLECKENVFWSISIWFKIQIINVDCTKCFMFIVKAVTVILYRHSAKISSEASMYFKDCLEKYNNKL